MATIANAKLDFCACEAPELVAKIEGREYPAQPSDSFGPAAALYLAQCRICGGAYKLPWRRIVPAGEPVPSGTYEEEPVPTETDPGGTVADRPSRSAEQFDSDAHCTARMRLRRAPIPCRGVAPDRPTRRGVRG